MRILSQYLIIITFKGQDILLFNDLKPVLTSDPNIQKYKITSKTKESELQLKYFENQNQRENVK